MTHSHDPILPVVIPEYDTLEDIGIYLEQHEAAQQRLGSIAAQNSLIRNMTPDDIDELGDILEVVYGTPKNDRSEREARDYEDYLEISGHDAVYDGIEQGADPETETDRFLDY